jgi:hypothetical protein
MTLSITTANNILLRYNYVSIPRFVGTSEASQASQEALATVLMNLSYFGRALSQEGYRALTQLTTQGLITWWGEVETQLKIITGESRKIGDFVVYKNFPQEVLDKTAAEYWIPQILMYWGFPKEFFTQEVKPRDKMDKQPKCLVLKLANDNSLSDILTSLCKSPARWKEEELADVVYLSDWYPINLAKMGFKENMVLVATHYINSGKDINITTATDVLRLAVGLSDGDVSLRTNSKFKSFSKPQRRFLLRTLEKCTNLKEDMARRPELWKRLIHQLHPGDWRQQFPQVCQAMNDLYKDRLTTFNSEVEQLLLAGDGEVLDLLQGRPGDFRRRLLHTVRLFGDMAVQSFTDRKVLSNLTTHQVVSLRTFLETTNQRKHRVFPPKGNWGKMQIAEAQHIPVRYIKAICQQLGRVLAERVPKVGVLDEETRKIKLPNNGESGPYARGTVFPIPEGVDFIRTASYWNVNANTASYVWFDNGWNFFSDDWKPLGACCWSNPNFPGRGYWNDRKPSKDTGAVFSGDPTIASGKACQMIDLYPEKLRAKGVRYAVWSILCYSGMAFNKAEDVFAAFQWGKDANKGKLFEPSRCQLAIPLTGDQLTKYVVLMDFDKNEMVYLDAGLKSSVRSAEANGPLLQKNLPAFMEYIKSLPSVYDLFRESVNDASDVQVLYSDAEAELTGEKAYVFRPENKASQYKTLDINSILT